jgi:Na+/proline symporter
MIDIAILLAFIAYAITSGFRARRKASSGLEQYFLAGRTLRGWQAGTSMAATQFAADTPLLVMGLVATAGIFSVWRLLVYGLAFLLMAYVFSGLWRRAGVLTDAELTEIRYSGTGVLALRVLKAVYYGLVINCVVLAMVLVAAVRIAEVFLPWNEWLPAGLYESLVGVVRWTGLTLASASTQLDPAIASTNNLISILSILAFTALYSTTGGLRSVVRTDVVQFWLAMIGTLAYAIIVVWTIGGLGELVPRVIDTYGSARATELLSFSPRASDAVAPFLVIIGLQWLFQMNSDGTGYLAQRCMGCATDGDARRAGVLFTWLQVFVRSLLWLVIAVGLLVIYPFDQAAQSSTTFAASREILFVTGINDLLPIGIRGLMLTGLLAALASTVDTHLNWGASYFSNDVYRRFVSESILKRTPGSRELVLVARLSSIAIVLLALVIMANLGSIQTAWFISLLFGAGMGSVLVLRWLWGRINLYSEVAAIALSLIVAPILLVATDQEWIRLGVMALVSTVGAVAVTWFTPRTETGVLLSFYRRVKPSGFWRTTALAAGDSPSLPLGILGRGVKSTLATAASLYLTLYGAGTLLVQGPDTSAPVSLLVLVIGIALIPLWWRDLAVTPEPESQAEPSGRP